MVYCAHNRCVMGSVMFTRTLELMYHLVFVFIWVFLGHHTLYDISRMDCNGKVRAQEKLYEPVAWQPQGSSWRRSCLIHHCCHLELGKSQQGIPQFHVCLDPINLQTNISQETTESLVWASLSEITQVKNNTARVWIQAGDWLNAIQSVRLWFGEEIRTTIKWNKLHWTSGEDLYPRASSRQQLHGEALIKIRKGLGPVRGLGR